MNIPENFDRWMFDYKEGNLSGGELQEFENFLIQNPEFEMEADAWEIASVQNQDFVYPHADQLEKDNRFAGAYVWSAAALLLLLVGISSVLLYNSGDSSAIEGFAGNDYLKTDDASSNHSVYNNSENQYAEQLSQFEAFSGNDLYNYVPNMAANNAANGNQPYAVNNNANQNVNNNNAINNNANSPNNNTVVAVNNSNLPVNNYTPDLNSFEADGISKALAQEEAKFDNDDFTGSYQENPEEKDLAFNVSKKSVNYNSLKNRLRRFYRAIEKQMGYPVALVNKRDPQLNIPQNTMLAHNPGFAGGMLTPRFEMNYRNQWPSSETASQTMNMSFDTYSKNLRGGFGVMVGATDYGYGAYDDFKMSLFYSPKIALGKNAVLEPAIKMTMGMVSTDANKLAGINQLEINRGRILNMDGADPTMGATRQWYKDWGLGAVLNTEKFYVGFSMDNLGGHYENTFNGDNFEPQRATMKKTAIIGTDWENKEQLMGVEAKGMGFSPFIAWENYDKRNDFWGGFTYRLQWFSIGGAYSSNKEWTATAGIKFPHFKISYQYDMTSSLLAPEAGLMGSHNVGIRFNAKPNNRIKKLRRR